MEEEFVANQERLKPQEEKTEEDRSKVDDLCGSPMSVGNLEELIDENHAIVSSSLEPEYYVGILSFVDKDQLEPGCAILMHNKVLSVVGLLQDEVDPMVSVMKVEKAPLESYADIGGLDAQIQEIKEAVELPLTHPELYEDIGIKPPKGVILYGEPGTGKTLLAKAVANSTSATFLRVVGSELIQKYLGDGPKLVRELFRVADDLSPSIIFIDEINAVGTKRYDAHSGGEREILRTMLELLNQLDGFDSRGDVKVILETNKIESLDPALLRPGRIDRKIEFPLLDIKTMRRIFQIHTSRMTLADDVNLEEFVMTKDEFSGADIKAICTEAGLHALRERRMKGKNVVEKNPTVTEVGECSKTAEDHHRYAPETVNVNDVTVDDMDHISEMSNAKANDEVENAQAKYDKCDADNELNRDVVCNNEFEATICENYVDSIVDHRNVAVDVEIENDHGKNECEKVVTDEVTGVVGGNDLAIIRLDNTVSNMRKGKSPKHITTKNAFKLLHTIKYLGVIVKEISCRDEAEDEAKDSSRRLVVAPGLSAANQHAHDDFLGRTALHSCKLSPSIRYSCPFTHTYSFRCSVLIACGAFPLLAVTLNTAPRRLQSIDVFYFDMPMLSLTLLHFSCCWTAFALSCVAGISIVSLMDLGFTLRLNGAPFACPKSLWTVWLALDSPKIRWATSRWAKTVPGRAERIAGPRASFGSAVRWAVQLLDHASAGLRPSAPAALGRLLDCLNWAPFASPHTATSSVGPHQTLPAHFSQSGLLLTDAEDDASAQLQLDWTHCSYIKWNLSRMMVENAEDWRHTTSVEMRLQQGYDKETSIREIDPDG
ncbi:26S proteasome regulatory subunitA [Sesamum alatum]|uniref:26S proteasome regulatory subunitA n=2 Tax=Eukaryota TaxID=2759 RepID=A0AAE1YA58_9LAMI|nr:26S proteasome regulatory subunitA [Sesamum alatum]